MSEKPRIDSGAEMHEPATDISSEILQDGAPSSAESLEPNKEHEYVLETKELLESISVLNETLGGLREEGLYGGSDIQVSDFKVVKFTELAGAVGSFSPKENIVKLLPVSAYSSHTIVHEALHLAAAWSFVENNKVNKDDKVQTGFEERKTAFGENNASVPPSRFLLINEGFTEYFAREMAKGISSDSVSHEEEMTESCNKEFDEMVSVIKKRIEARESKGVGTSEMDIFLNEQDGRDIESVEEDRRLKLHLVKNPIPDAYERPVSIVSNYMLHKVIKRYNEAPLEGRKPFTQFYSDIKKEALVAYLAGDRSFLSDLDEVFGPGATDELSLEQDDWELYSKFIMRHTPLKIKSE